MPHHVFANERITADRDKCRLLARLRMVEVAAHLDSLPGPMRMLTQELA